MNYYQYIQQQGEQRGELRGEQRGFKKGEQSGLKKGEQLGLKKGEQKAKQAIAKTLLKQGVSTQIIATATGLDEQSIQALETKGSNSAAQITENSEE